MTAIAIQNRGLTPPPPRRPATAPSQAPQSRPAGKDALELSPAARKTYSSATEAAAEGAAEGAVIGGAIANGAIGAMMIRKGMQGAVTLPTKLGGRIMPVVGIGLSVWGMASSGVALKKELDAETVNKRAVLAHGLSFTGNALIAGGSVAVLTGVGTAPGLVASGVGFAMTAAAVLIAP